MKTMQAYRTNQCKWCGKLQTKGVDLISPIPTSAIPGLVGGKVRENVWVHKHCAEQYSAGQPQPTFDSQSAQPSPAPAGTPKAPPAQPSAGGLDGLIMGLIDQRFTSLMGDSQSIEDMINARLDDALSSALAPVVRELHFPPPLNKVKQLTGARHAVYDRAFSIVRHRKPLMLVGPAGTGKSHLARQLADDLGLTFGYLPCTEGTSEHNLLGRLVPTGAQGEFKYRRPDFLRAYEEGGVFLLDEMDRCNANMLACINGLLANGHASVPDRYDIPYANRHPDFILIVACNTWGHGADRQYCGANQLDGSTLDRFALYKLFVDYSTELEAALCPAAEIRDFFQEARRLMRESRIERVISTRMLEEAYFMHKAEGWSLETIKDQFFADWSADERNKVGA